MRSDGKLQRARSSAAAESSVAAEAGAKMRGEVGAQTGAGAKMNVAVEAMRVHYYRLRRVVSREVVVGCWRF
jgi:hypothetical protein